LERPAPDGGVNLALFNLTDNTAVVSCPAVEFPQDMHIYDLWTGAYLGKSNGDINAEIEPHGSVLYGLFKTKKTGEFGSNLC
jgi:hypothetical protein